jgi:hypothetical protein
VPENRYFLEKMEGDPGKREGKNHPFPGKRCPDLPAAELFFAMQAGDGPGQVFHGHLFPGKNFFAAISVE